MEYGNCTCQASCEDPENTMECQTACSEEETCICQEGFLREGDNCVPPGECSCFIEGEGVISVMRTYFHTFFSFSFSINSGAYMQKCSSNK